MTKFATLAFVILNVCGGIFGANVKISTKQDCNFPTIFDPAANLDTIISLRIPKKQGREGEFVCPNAEIGFYPADPFCTGFYYTCVNSVAYLQECPGTPGVTVFDSATKTCRPIECSFCYFTCPASSGFYAVPGTCGSDYYICVGGQAAIGTCPLGAIFDPVILDCEPAEKASCNQPFTCPSDGVHPYPEVCSTFYYLCTGGQSSVQYCPGGSIFDPETLSCVLNENAPCSPGGTPPTTTTTESLTSTTPAGPFTCTSEGFFPYQGNCSLYYICTAVGADPIVVPCPSGLVYNPDTTYCDNPENVPGCAFTNFLEENARDDYLLRDHKSYLVNKEFICPSDDGFFPKKLDGSHYFSCVGGIPYPKVCPGITVFDPKKSSCVAIE